MNELVYSKYFTELQDKPAKRRYKEKMQVLGYSKDPFCLLESKTRTPDSLEWHEGLMYHTWMSTTISIHMSSLKRIKA